MIVEPFVTDRDLGDEDDFQALLGRRMDARIFRYRLHRVEKMLFRRMDMVRDLAITRPEAVA